VNVWLQGLTTVASAISATVLNALWQDALLVLCVWLLLRLWPGVNAATRYSVWSATLVAAFVVPIATTAAFFSPQPAPAARVATTLNHTERYAASEPSDRAQQAPRVRSARAQGRVSDATPAAPARLPERAHVTIPLAVALAVFALWLVLAIYALVRLAAGLIGLERLKRDALPLPVEYRDAMPQWLRANKGARDVRLCVSDETDVPVAVGLFDAMILIPRSLLERLSEPEVDQICLHELAHLRRADDWTNGVQRMIGALLGWNPAAQFIGQQLDLEREVACDDWVLSFVGKVRPYALCLTKMAETATWPRQPMPAPGVFATRKHISLRIERLLGAGRNIATNLSFAPAAAAVAIVGVIGLLIAFVAPSVAASALPMPAAAPMAAQVQTTAQTPAPAVREVREITRIVRVAATAPPRRVAVSEAPAAPGVPSAPKLNVALPASIGKELAQSIQQSVGAGVSTALKAAGAAKDSNVGGDFSGVNWAGRDLHGANYDGTDFSKANLVRVNFAGGSFNGVDFSRANLEGASFRNARLAGCDFSHANLTGVDFTGVKMSGCQFPGARLGSSQLRDVLDACTGCDFGRADLSGLDLRGVHVNGDDFSGADLRNVNFAGAMLVGTDFSNAKLDGANLAGATINGCDLSGVDLSRVDLSKTKLIGVDLRER
jgi:uncharacterized protein YjbI with pentapeptide repeats/beta-lactamase regulating signal transducer with metallopeptidase domain